VRHTQGKRLSAAGRIDDGLRIESITSSEPILDSLNFSRPKNGEQCNSASGNWPW
jgi:hypothetical protein